MKSIRAKILFKCVGAMLFIVVAFLVTSTLAKTIFKPRSELLIQLCFLERDAAIHAYEVGGREALSRYLNEVNAHFPDYFFVLTNASGRNLISGVDESALLARAKSLSALYGPPGTVVASTGSLDGRYRLIVRGRLSPVSPFLFLPYYMLALATLVVLSYSLLADIANPLRKLMEVVEAFGKDDLSVRSGTVRKDQIGDLAKSFDQMADRIQVLVYAERRLLQDVAHELRSPLARLTLATGLLNSEETRERGVMQIRRDIERFSRMLDAVLQITRAEGDAGAFRAEPMNLSDLLQEISADCSVEAESRRCELKVSCQDVLWLEADRELLRRAIENVIRNAIRYSPQNSVVDVVALSQQSQFTLEIRDQGPGVPEAMLSRIFEPFFRVDESRDSSTGGIGLGLAITKRAIALHNGRLSARNTSPGLGVKITLPIKKTGSSDDPIRAGSLSESSIDGHDAG